MSNITEVTNFIGGEHVKTAETFNKVSPVTGEVIAKVYEADKALVDRAVDNALDAFRSGWGTLSVDKRCMFMHRIADGIEARADEFVAAECSDVGVPEPLARNMFVGRSAFLFRMFANQVQQSHERAYPFEAPDSSQALGYTLRRPKGVIGAIAPWNVPLLLLTFKVAPALATGNTVVAKPSEVTPQSALLLAEVIRDAGLPDGVFNVVQGFGRDSAGEYLTENPNVSAFAFTGESGTGSAIMRAASKGVREVSLELGGKNPGIIFADANLEDVLPGSRLSCFSNTGQICLSTERLYVQRPIFDEFVERLHQTAKSIVIGRPFDEGTQMGPLVSHDHREKVLGAIDKARKDGGNIVFGGDIPEFGDDRDGGAFIRPCIVTGLPETASLVTDEVFGPVAHITPFDTEEEAISMANDTAYGLTSTIWTQDLSRGHRVAAAMRSGLVWVNTWQLRDLRSPFAGHGLSGVGTQGGRESLDFFTDTSTITLKI